MTINSYEPPPTESVNLPHWKKWIAGFFEWAGTIKDAVNSASTPSVSADNGDAAATLTVGTSNTTQVWNTALTAARVITLSTTSATNGSKFRIVRTSNATGAYDLTIKVGATTVKALSIAGSSADVEYDGTTWILTNYSVLEPYV